MHGSASSANSQSGHIAFTGDDSEFRDIVVKGAGLELVTFGFYRFWLATKIRQHLWSHTTLDGDAFEYHGTGRELLIGFFFALAILAPVYFSSFLLGVEAERREAFTSTIFPAFFLVFAQFALYRARRYRLHRTSWRGLRFSMDGSGWAYAARAVGWGVATFLSLGLALPWMAAALERYKMRHTFYGDQQGDFVGKGGEFFKRAWGIWFLALGGSAASIAIVARVAASEAATEARGFADAGGAVALLVLFYLAAIGIAPFLYAAFKGVQWKWWLEGVRIGETSATSSLERGSFLGNVWTYIGMTIVVAVIGVIAIAIVFSLVPSKGGAGSVFGVIVIAAFYLAMVLAMTALFRIYFIQRVWKIVVGSLTVHKIEAVAEAASLPEERRPTALGEGFADGLDIAGF